MSSPAVPAGAGAAPVAAGRPTRRPDADGWLVARVWLASRLLVLGAALYVMVTRRRSIHDMITAWDVVHFEAIAANGYADPLNRAFFPGLPFLLRAGTTFGIPGGAMGVVVGCAGSALAAWALLRLGGPWAACLWLVAPTTVFTTIAYTEAPFCAAAFWAWERATQRRWAQAALLAAVACTFRVSGLFLVGALGLFALTQRGVPGLRRLLHACLVALALLVLVAHAWNLHRISGSWNAWQEAQQAGWGRGFHSPVEAFHTTWQAAQPSSWPDRPLVAKVFFAEIISLALGAALTLVLLLRRRWGEAGWVGVQVLALGTSTWFISVNRALLLWFPLWLLLAGLARWGGRRGIVLRSTTRLVLAVVALASTLCMVWWSWLLFTGSWAS